MTPRDIILSEPDSYGTMCDANDFKDTAATTTTNEDTGVVVDIGTIHRSKYHFVPIDDAIEKLGTGGFQHRILLAAGLCFMADAMEVLLLSFLSTVLKHEWNLTEREVDSILAVVFAGALLGTLVLGQAGDRFGRKPVFAVTASMIAVAGVATALCQTYEHLLLARFWVGFGVGGLTVPFDTLGEFLPNAARGKNLLGIEFFWTFGTLSVPALAYLTLDTSAFENGEESHWQLFVILCSIPCFLSAFLGLCLVPESPRWLLEQSHDSNANAKALEILKAAARTNGISQTTIDEELFPPNTMLVLSLDEAENHINSNSHAMTTGVEDDSTDGHQHEQSNKNLGNFGELFRTPERTKLTIALWATWFGFGFLYYGVIIAVSLVFTNEQSSSSSYGNDDDFEEGTSSSSYDFDFAAIFITASAELFGLIAVLCTIDSVGRIPSQTMAYRIGGISTFVLGILCFFWIEHGNDSGDDKPFHRYTLIGFAFVSRMAMMASSCTTWVSTSEMLSTEIRSTGHGAANAMARLGGFIAPFVITEGNSMGMIGALVLLVSFVTAECASTLPETAGKPMGDTTKGGVSSSNAISRQTKQDDHAMKQAPTESITSYHKLL